VHVTPHPVFIEWGDACSIGDGWLNPDDFEDDDVAPCGVVSVGWLVRESESAVVLALSIAENGLERETFLVPKATIKTMVRLVPHDRAQ
jgi:hypothetical protein